MSRDWSTPEEPVPPEAPPAPQAGAEPSDGWSRRPVDAGPDTPTGLVLKETHLLAGVLAAGVIVAGLALISRPAQVTPVTDPEPRPIVARVILPAGDTRPLQDVCAEYGVSPRLCSLSERCAREANLRPQSVREVRLILRSSDESCARVLDAGSEP